MGKLKLLVDEIVSIFDEHENITALVSSEVAFEFVNEGKVLGFEFGKYDIDELLAMQKEDVLVIEKCTTSTGNEIYDLSMIYDKDGIIYIENDTVVLEECIFDEVEIDKYIEANAIYKISIVDDREKELDDIAYNLTEIIENDECICCMKCTIYDALCEAYNMGLEDSI